MWCAGKGAVFMKIPANTELFHHIRPYGAPSPQVTTDLLQCHCEAPQEPWQSQAKDIGIVQFYVVFCQRFPRRQHSRSRRRSVTDMAYPLRVFAPRNDKRFNQCLLKEKALVCANMKLTDKSEFNRYLS